MHLPPFFEIGETTATRWLRKILIWIDSSEVVDFLRHQKGLLLHLFFSSGSPCCIRGPNLLHSFQWIKLNQVRVSFKQRSQFIFSDLAHWNSHNYWAIDTCSTVNRCSELIWNFTWINVRRRYFWCCGNRLFDLFRIPTRTLWSCRLRSQGRLQQ